MMTETDNAGLKNRYSNITKYVQAITFFLIIAFLAIIALNELNHWQYGLIVTKSNKYHLSIADHTLAILNEVQAFKLWYSKRMEIGVDPKKKSPVHVFKTTGKRVDHFTHSLTPHMKRIIALQQEYADPSFSQITDRLRGEYERTVSRLSTLSKLDERSSSTNMEIEVVSAPLTKVAHQLQIYHEVAQFNLQEKLADQKWWQSLLVYTTSAFFMVLGYLIVPRMYRSIFSIVETLRQNENRLEHLLTASPAVIYTCIVNEPFACTFISLNITRQLGYKPEDFITNEEFWANHIHPEDTQRTLAEFLHVLEKGRLTLEYRFLHKNGTYRWMHDELTLVRDSEGHPLELAGYWIDITERKKGEEEIAAAYAQLRQLTRQLGMAEEKERKRIARELHDEFGQTLAGLKFDLTKLSKQLIQELPAQSIVGYHSQFKSMTNTVDTAIHSMRRIATDLRPSLLDDLGLVAALEWLLQSFQARTSIDCTLTVSPDVSTLGIDLERSLALFRIIQELLTNVLKHAGASKVTITITLEDGTLALAFTDDGRGVTKEELAHTTSLGLVGIKERLAVFDGQLTIQGDPDKGTCVGIQIPLTPAPTPVA